MSKDTIYPQPCVVGRGQGHIVSKLFGQTLQFNKAEASYLTGPIKIERTQHSIPELVQVQLRYDIIRANIISCLFGEWSHYGQLNALQAFIKSAIPSAPEPYFLDAMPDPDGRCPWCGFQLAR
jgi:hypothetical protein